MSSKKGISLPINMLVILAISIIVLLAVVAFFMGTFAGQAGTVREKSKINACCGWLMGQGGCYQNQTYFDNEMANYFKVDYDNDGTKEDCTGLAPGTDLDRWKRACACPTEYNISL